MIIQQNTTKTLSENPYLRVSYRQVYADVRLDCDPCDENVSLSAKAFREMSGIIRKLQLQAYDMDMPQKIYMVYSTGGFLLRNIPLLLCPPFVRKVLPIIREKKNFVKKRR